MGHNSDVSGSLEIHRNSAHWRVVNGTPGFMGITKVDVEHKLVLRGGQGTWEASKLCA